MRFRHLLNHWFTADRIRTSPREGKLLRLDIGACLRIGGILYAVARVDRQADRQAVTYHCDGESASIALTAIVAADGRISVMLHGDRRTTPIDPADINVFG